MLHNLLQFTDSYLPSLSTSRARCYHNFKFTLYQTSIDNCKYAFFPRTAPERNNLTAHIVKLLKYRMAGNLTGIKFEEIASKLHNKNMMDFKFDEMLGKKTHSK